MSDPTALLTTLDDYLLSLADGVALAQHELSRTAAAGPPGKQFAYYLPKLEFELRMTMQVTQSQELSDRYAPVRMGEVRDKHLLFSPVTNTTQSQTEVVSILKGSFVAVPANDGLPAIVLSTALQELGGGQVEIVVEARTAAGAVHPGLSVEANLDRDDSATWSAEEGVTSLDWSGTTLDAAVIDTDAQGRSRFVLTVGAAMAAGAQLVLTFDAAGQTETLIYQVTP